MDEHQLRERFPGLEVGRKPVINGLTTLSGRRDFDPETGTYVITNYICFLSMPVIAIGAYRVADAEGGGWYCLGRVPLHGSAKVCNAALLATVLAVAGGIWWYVHTHSEEYLARQKLARADEAAAAGQGGEAAKLCREVMDGKAPKAAEQAKQKLAGLIESPPGSPSEVAAVYTVAADLHRESRCPVPDLFGVGKTVAAKFAADDPDAALALLEIIAPPRDGPRGRTRRSPRAARKAPRAFAQRPGDASRPRRYEAKGERSGARSCSPLREATGSRDGAAILGRICADRGEFDRANALLRPFVEARLPAPATRRRVSPGWPSPSRSGSSRICARRRPRGSTSSVPSAWARTSRPRWSRTTSASKCVRTRRSARRGRSSWRSAAWSRRRSIWASCNFAAVRRWPTRPRARPNWRPRRRRSCRSAASRASPTSTASRSAACTTGSAARPTRRSCSRSSRRTTRRARSRYSRSPWRCATSATTRVPGRWSRTPTTARPT